jgi:NAD(P)H-dependent flavin oxidoreductase YrpB (nitropropane dioxygenase family)
MGTRFLLTKESTVPDTVKHAYLQRGLTDTVVTRKVDGIPHRLLRTELVEGLERSGPATGFARAARNAVRFRRLTGLSWSSLVREGIAMKRGNDRTWSQVLMAANTPMLLRAALVYGDTGAGVLASGQVVGLLDDLPAVADLIEGIVGDASRIIEQLASL